MSKFFHPSCILGFHLLFFAVTFPWIIKQSSAVDFNITLNLTQLSSMGQLNIILGSSGRMYCLPGQESWYVYVIPEDAFNTCTTNNVDFIEVGSCSKDYTTIDIITLPIKFPNIPSFVSGNPYYLAAYEVSAGTIVSNDPCVDGYKFSFQVVDHLVATQNCTLPSKSFVDQALRDVITGSVTIRGGPYYTCQVQGTTMETYQELSIIMEYTDSGGDKVGQFEMTCANGNQWIRRQYSLTILSTGSGVTYDDSIGLRTNCSSCINTAGNDNNCVACHAKCNVGLMRCTDSGSDDCCAAFEDNGDCSPDTDCNNTNFIATAQNNFTCGCNLTCDPGYSITTNSSDCYCVLSDICMTQPSPCNNSGSCTLTSPPDNFTCDCSGTGFTGDTCEELILSTTTTMRTTTTEVMPSVSSSSVATMITTISPSTNVTTPAAAAGTDSTIPIIISLSILLLIILVTSGLLIAIYCYRKGQRTGNSYSTKLSKFKSELSTLVNPTDVVSTTNPVQSQVDSTSPAAAYEPSSWLIFPPPQRSTPQPFTSAFPSRCLIESSDLKKIEKIGQGEFGVVYRGTLTKYHKNEPTIIPVAIKTIKRMYMQSQLTDLLIDEAEKMMHFNHFNVLSLTGICVDLLNSPCLVMPYMSNGSLLSYLRKESADLTVSNSAEESIILDTMKQLLSMCLQVAKGMVYLTEQKFVHRDLAARNCMISSDGVIKVADFGLAEDVYSSGYFKQDTSSEDSASVKLPLNWMPLESIHYGKFNEKTDVWSYGVLCWEVFTIGKKPYAAMRPKEVVRMLESGERLDKPATPTCSEEIYSSLMLSCWDGSAEERPCFTDIVDKVEALLVPLAGYMDFNDLCLNLKQ